MGTLGPKLKEIDFETRKAKKRRLELESLRKKCEFAKSPTKDMLPNSSAASLQSAISSTIHSEDDLMQGSGHSRDNGNGVDVVSDINDVPDRSDVDVDVDVDVDADAKSLCSIASCRSDASSSCGYVRLTMFPLYVLEVREHWPESGRARKVVEIDTAIEMMKSRPEFYQVLIEVKEKGYHLKPHRRIRTEDGDVEDNI